MSSQSVVEKVAIDNNPNDEIKKVEDDGDTTDKKWCTKTVMINSLLLVLWLGVILGVGFTFGYLFPVDDWYAALNKSPGTPPNVVFPVVWSLLYISLGVIGWFLCLGLKERKIVYLFIIYIVQQILNFVWVPVFQKLHQLVAGLIILNAMIILNGILIVGLFLVKLKIIGVKTSILGAVLIPYFLWLCYAMHLNAYAVAMNPTLL